MAEGAEEEVLQVHLGSDRCLPREPARGLPHSQFGLVVDLCFCCFKKVGFLLTRVGKSVVAKASESARDDLEEVQRLFRSAARDCVAEDRNSFVAFQANTGVEVCPVACLSCCSVGDVGCWS